MTPNIATATEGLSAIIAENESAAQREQRALQTIEAILSERREILSGGRMINSLPLRANIMYPDTATHLVDYSIRLLRKENELFQPKPAPAPRELSLVHSAPEERSVIPLYARVARNRAGVRHAIAAVSSVIVSAVYAASAFYISKQGQ